ncbi:MAG: hypothetical protein QOD03_893, partial [Verrucomicrobiota bacterium]
ETAGANKKAYDDLWALLEEKPDYPDKSGILKRLLNLATEKLKTREDIDRCEQALAKYSEESPVQATKQPSKPL